MGILESLPAKEVLSGNDEEESADRVHIPIDFGESDTESDTLSEKLRKIDAYNEDIQGGSQVNENTSNQQVCQLLQLRLQTGRSICRRKLRLCLLFFLCLELVRIRDVTWGIQMMISLTLKRVSSLVMAK
jgi:hypothetical protein